MLWIYSFFYDRVVWFIKVVESNEVEEGDFFSNFYEGENGWVVG